MKMMVPGSQGKTSWPRRVAKDPPIVFGVKHLKGMYESLPWHVPHGELFKKKETKDVFSFTLDEES